MSLAVVPPREYPPVEAYAEDQDSGIAKQPLLALLWFASLNEIASQDHLVRDLLLAASLFVIFGESNSGKTFWLLDLCFAIAAGRPWRGRHTRKGLVIYVAGEGAASVRMRVTAYRTAHPDIIALPFAIVPFAVNFLSAESVACLVATIQAAEGEVGEKAVLVVIDTFARAIPGGNENDAQDVGVAVAAGDRIRSETGAAVGFVHHAGKDPSKGARGSSALRAAVDTEVLVEKGQDGKRVATVTKQRDLAADTAMPFELVPVPVGTHADDGTDITSCVVKQVSAEVGPAGAAAMQLRGKAQRTLVSALRARSALEPAQVWTLMDLRAIGRELGMSKGTARSVVDAIAATTYLRPTIGGYRFTDGRVEG